MATDEQIERAANFLGEYLAEFIGPTHDPKNTYDHRYVGDHGTVDATLHAVSLCVNEDRARSQLDDLKVGERLKNGKRGCYMKLVVETGLDGYDYLKIEKTRDC